MNINFSNIRTYNGSQNAGFEELVCQLAHLQKPENALRFIRKEGAGGDAGVECYWILKDGSEICWQAKYFPDGMNPDRWRQLDKSFSTALERHPNLTKYVVCLPLDKSDSRRKGQGDKQVVSVQDTWNKHITKWQDEAQKQGRSVEFEYWGKHEITFFLTTDDPSYSGRALYWFDESVLSFEKFKNISSKAREYLGDRYTPEFHVDLPIAETFDGLCLNNQWWEDIEEKIVDLNEKEERFFKTFLKDPELLDKEKVTELRDKCSKVSRILSDGLGEKDTLFNVQGVQKLLGEISKYDDVLYKEYAKNIQGKRDDNQESRVFHDFFHVLRDFYGFFNTNKVKTAKIKAALLYGEAGIGKSHLLCDISLHRTENGQPTIFLLGSQYGGGNPIELIKDAIDLKGHSDTRILGAIDAAGEASGSRALIVIDAINEGSHREDWHNYIISFLSDVSKFNNIAILLSCRSTYLRYILPENINENRLVQIEHLGFQGYEHRAAEKYLSQQGISKPSAPILAPEFTNPLFLKTCCQTLKANKQTTFPRGLHGITKLFDFYIQSVEKTIAKHKHYTPEEEILKCALNTFSSKLFPEHLTGIPTGEARKIFKKHDPNKNIGEPLFDKLLHEGVLSEDILYDSEGWGTPFVRFTYERFSDYFVAQQILEPYNSDTIDSIFSADQPFGKIILDQGYYRYAGILEALAIIIAEKYNKELVDLIPRDADITEWQVAKMFSNTVIWRSPNSFSDRTLELLNKIKRFENDNPALDILLKLSTEPSHPWNARLIHSNLINKEIAERDHFWSIYVAFGYSSEEDEGFESIVRTLIEWSCFADIEEVEEERIRLCAITLLWFLTTPNREVRDRSTKSLVRILSRYPSLLTDLLREFHSINDLYLVERLYAVAYGVICNIDDRQIISDIAVLVFELVFKDGKPIPHILLRDYARGILELALQKKLLPDDINADLFRPPYNSEWPIENPTEDEIDAIIGDEEDSEIKSSLMGFPGDFGRYTMGCVHRWSSTPLSESAPETGSNLKKKFAEKHLQGEVRAEYLKKIKPKKRVKNFQIISKKVDAQKNIRSLAEILKENELSEKRKKSREQKLTRRERKLKEQENFEEKIKAQIGDDNREYYRWLSGLSNDRPAAFSRKWAQRWVCKRAYELGWREELFYHFETYYSRGGGHGPGSGAMERVGKKYQWIAFYELLARLSDNVHWIDRGYDDIEDKHYYGPWQINKRDIDPTIWIRRSDEYLSYYNKVDTWWQPYKFPFDDLKDIPDQREFSWDKQKIPEFSELLRIEEPDTQNQWTVLRGFWQEEQRQSSIKADSSRLDCWFRINSIFIRKEDYTLVEKKLKNKALTDPFIIRIPSTDHQGYLGEYPWHPVCRFMSGWYNSDRSFDLIPTEYFSPVSEYEKESGGRDYSLDSFLSFYLPAKELVESLCLRRSHNDFGSWENDDGVIFCDPSIKQYGPSYALMDSQKLDEWLDKNGLEVLWLIGGEKLLIPPDIRPREFCGLKYSGLFRIVNGIPTGLSWFEREDSRKNKDRPAGLCQE